ncbi:MAG: NADP-dependent oxidoreductase [Bryobacteraceae bacterium]
MPSNRQIVLAARPSGPPRTSDFALVETPSPSPADGDVLVRIVFLSVDPYMRALMNEAGSGYRAAVAIGAVMVGGAVGQVVESRDPRIAAGDFVEGMFGWQEYAVARASGVRKLDPSLAPVSTALGVLGMPGMTAYFGLLEIGRPKPGETVVVSGAAGAVGSLVGQIARIQGCRVVGAAGDDAKVAWLVEELGFDGAFNYKTTADYHARLGELCPAGIDVYFDNTGGAITNAVLRRINTGARIAICGQISQYNLARPEPVPAPYLTLLVKQARMEGFLVFQFASRYAEGARQMAAWLGEGKLHFRERIAEGIENAPQAFLEMLEGRNTGKQLVRVAAN